MCGGVGEKVPVWVRGGGNSRHGCEVGETVDMVARWGEPSQLGTKRTVSD